MGDLEKMIEAIVDRRLEQRLAERDRQAAQREADADKLLTSSEVAALLGTTRRALAERWRRARKEGAMHPVEQLAITIDGVRRWRRDDVLSYVEASRLRRKVGGGR